MKWRLKIIKWLAMGRPVAVNLFLTRGLYIDGTKSPGGFYHNVNIDWKADDREIPDGCGFHIYGTKLEA